MKYNKSQIMKTAWTMIKEHGMNRSDAMKAAWAQAKAMVKANEMGENSIFDHYEIKSNSWCKYGKNRTYIEMVGYYSDGKRSKPYKVGYVDNLTATFYAA